MMGQPTNSDSVSIVNLIREGSVGAEIGVWMGNSSRRFLSRNPSKLFLVDPWSVSGYQPAIDANDDTHDEQYYYERYSRITGGNDEASFNKYYSKIADGVVREFGHLSNVEICRMNSTEWFAQYDKPFLDWIYIDGDHSYTAVYSDFSNALKVVKSGGLIMGDDYHWGKPVDKGGVKRAIDQWAEENQLTLEKYGQKQVVVRI